MKTLIRLFYLVVTGILLFSCDDYLDIKPKGELIPETAKDYETMLNESEVLKASDSYPIFLTDDVFLPDVSVNYTPGLNSVTRNVKNLYKFNSEVFGESEDDYLWTGSYNRLYYYNVVAEHVLTATEATEKEKQSIRAEALMGRAFEYLTLVNAYAKHYDPKTAATEPGVPIILDDNINRTNLKRATVKEVYEQIQADLKEAEKYLPEKSKINAFRASKVVGLGLLARMYLYMGNYQEALRYANKSLEKDDFLLDLKAYEVKNPYRAIGRTDVPDRGKNLENIYIRLAPYVFGASATAFVSEDLLKLYDKEKDKRFLLYITNKPFGMPNDYYLWMPYLYTNMAFSTPEMYLIAAECEARVGSKEKAMNLINKLRDYRIVENTPLNADSNEDALVKVLEERRREFAMLGCTRLIDLKRLNREPKLAKTVIHKGEGQTYTLKPNDPKYVLPIPDKIIRFNPNMKQNKR